MEETRAAFAQQNEHNNQGRGQELPSNIHEDSHIRTSRKRHCAFGLLNALSFNRFAEDFVSLGGDVVGEDELTDKQKNNKSFQMEAEGAFFDPDNCGKQQFSDDRHFKGGVGINPSNIETHDWKRLLTIHKDVKK